MQADEEYVAKLSNIAQIVPNLHWSEIYMLIKVLPQDKYSSRVELAEHIDQLVNSLTDIKKNIFKGG